MPYDSYFYFNKKGIDAVYGHEPAGTLSISRLIQGKAPWKQAGLSSSQQKKTLILTDWTAAGWSDARVKRMQEKFRALKQDGFSFYIWLDKELVQMSDAIIDRLNEPDFRKKITPVSAENIAKKAVEQLGVTYDEVASLDDYWAGYLDKGILPERHTLNLTDLLALLLPGNDPKASTEQIYSVVRMAEQANPPCTGLVIDRNNFTGNQTVVTELLQKKLPHLSMETSFHHIDIGLDDKAISWLEDNQDKILKLQSITLKPPVDDSEKTASFFTDFLSRYSNQLKHQEINSLFGIDTIDKNNMPTLESLKINVAVPPEFLANKLRSCPNLLTLDLSKCDDYSFPDKALQETALEHIIFDENTKPGGQGIALARLNILMASPKLKKLSMKEHLYMDEGFTEHLNLKHLVELDLTNSNITSKDLHQLLKNAPGIRRLKLKGCRQIDASAFEGLDLSQIEFIDFPSNFDVDAHLELLKRMTGLRAIDMSAFSSEQSLKFFNEASFSQLERIHMQKRTQPALFSDAQQQIIAASSLSRYLMDNISGSGHGQEIQDIPNGNLRNLLISNSKINIEQFQSLVKGAVKLDTLTIHKSSIQGDDFKISPLSNMEVLQIESSSIMPETFNTFVRNSPNLKELHIDNTSLFQIPLNTPFNLPSLSYLTINNERLETNDLKALLAHSRNLRMLRLKDVDVRPGADKNTEASSSSSDTLQTAALDWDFPELTELDAGNMPFGALSSILKTSPKLTKLVYTGTIQSLSDNIMLPALEELNVRLAGIVDNDALRPLLFSSGRNLKTLELPNSEMLTPDFADGLYFQNLQVLKFNRGHLDKGTLIGLLKAAPNLILLDLRNINIELDDELDAWLKPPLKVIGIGALQSKKEATHSASSSSSSVSNENASIDRTPHHNAESHKNFVPFNEKTAFIYKGRKRSLDQSMLIEQVSQYLTLTSQHQHIIPKIQDGMCFALSNLFKETGPEQWQQFINPIAAWNGQDNTLTSELNEAFDNLVEYIQKYQLGTHSSTIHFVGRLAAEAMIKNKKSPYIISNPWHAIAIKYNEKQKKWHVYDPNYVEGYKTCSDDQLQNLIKLALGDLITVYNLDDSPHNIHSADAFFAEGGLLSLCFVKNYRQLQQMLPPAGLLSNEALEGILLRDMAGTPAWVLALNSPRADVKNYAKSMLEVFVSRNPTHWQRKIQQSINCLSPESRHNVIANLHADANRQPKRLLRGTLDAVCDLLRNSPSTANIKKSALESYKTALQTWGRNEGEETSLKVFCQKIFIAAADKPEQAVPDNQLLELPDRQTLDALGLHLQKFCKDTGRECFYIDSPEDLICSSAFVRRDGRQGYLSKGPGGSLHEFLTKPRPQGSPDPVLLVNYDNFDANDLVRFNALIDEERRADGTAVPAAMKVVGLFNPHKPDSYKGSDFYSRFGRVTRPRFGSEQKPFKKLNKVLLTSSEVANDAYSVKLFHSPDWKEQLLGRWVLENNALSFHEGKLVHAFNEGKHQIQIEKGPWNDREFLRFWEEALRLGYIDYEGRRIVLPDNIQLIQRDEYHWQQLGQNIQFSHGLSADSDAIPMNPSAFSDWFNRYQCDNAKQSLTTLPGWLCEANRSKTLQMNLTRDLSEDEWARVADACQRLEIQMVCHVAEGLKVPVFFQAQQAASSSSSSSPEPETQPLMPWQGEAEAFLLIQSTDVETTAAMLKDRTGAQTLVLDISDSEPADLLHRLDTEVKTAEGAANPHFVFKAFELAVSKALAQGQTVILKGDFSPALADALTVIWLERASSSSKGKLILVTDSIKYFPAVPKMVHQVTVQEKQALLLNEGDVDPLSSAQWQNESLTRLQTRILYNKAHPEAPSTDEAWQGMLHLEGHVRTGTFDPETSARDAKIFQDKRLADVQSILNDSPYVYLSGLTAVGKTSFVEKNLCTENDKLYTGENAMEAWAKDDVTEGMKVLFIDEANLANINFNHFEGLYADPPSILIKGELHPLTSRHKLVFAGNPLSYGEGRSMPEFFRRRGNALVFEPLSQAFVYEYILKPVFSGTPIEANTAELSTDILRAYSFLCACSTDQVLISPRELQMIALLTVAACQKNPQITAHDAVSYYIRQLARPLVPETRQPMFDNQFPGVDILSDSSSQAVAASSSDSAPVQRSKESQSLGNYWLSESRRQAADTVNSWLDLRDARQQSSMFNTPQQLYGGLGAMVLEGSPAAGKSELLLSLLAARGFREAKMEDKKTSGNIFYRMPVSMPLEEKQKMLLKAFHAGAVVIVDELNSSPMLERFMNALLMGKNPEAKGDEDLQPKRPGFMLFGTQNPTSMQGRVKAGEALERRQQKIVLKDYSVSEVSEILVHQGVHREHAENLATAFIQQLNKARNENLNPPPTLREVVRLAKEHALHIAPKQAASQKPAIDNQLMTIRAQVQQIIQKEIANYTQNTMFGSFFHSTKNQGKKMAFMELSKIVRQDPIDEFEVQNWYQKYHDRLTETDSLLPFMNDKPDSQKSIEQVFKLLEIDQSMFQSIQNNRP